MIWGTLFQETTILEHTNLHIIYTYTFEDTTQALIRLCLQTLVAPNYFLSIMKLAIWGLTHAGTCNLRHVDSSRVVYKELQPFVT